MTRETLCEIAVNLADMNYNEWSALKAAVERCYSNQLQTMKLDSDTLGKAFRAENRKEVRRCLHRSPQGGNFEECRAFLE